MSPEEIAYTESAQALDQQRAALESFRQRAANFTAAAAVVTSLFAGLTVDQNSGPNGLQVAALIVFLLVCVAMFLIQWPWKAWHWRPRAADLVADYVDEPDPERDVEDRAREMLRDEALFLGENYDRNERVLDRLYVVWTAGGVFVGAEILLWMFAI
ncbi:MAG: hypothetical protein WD556_09505 [Actinomycetota bacterium]